MRPSPAHDSLPEIAVDVAHRRWQQGELTLLDVREAFEVAQARVPGAATIPLSELPARLGELDEDRPVGVICRSGNRSTMATAHLRHLGVDAVNVAGGLIAWHGAGLPIDTGQRRAA